MGRARTPTKAHYTGVTSRPCSYGTWARGAWRTPSGKEHPGPQNPHPLSLLFSSPRALVSQPPFCVLPPASLASLFSGPGKAGRHWSREEGGSSRVEPAERGLRVAHLGDAGAECLHKNRGSRYAVGQTPRKSWMPHRGARILTCGALADLRRGVLANQKNKKGNAFVGAAHPPICMMRETTRTECRPAAQTVGGVLFVLLKSLPLLGRSCQAGPQKRSDHQEPSFRSGIVFQWILLGFLSTKLYKLYIVKDL